MEFAERNNTKRIAKNTIILYIRMFFTMIVSLYTSRIVLNALGVSEFGIYNVVGGVVLMFSSVNTTMATAVQRFMNFEMGKKSNYGLNAIFNTSVIIHITIAVLVFVLLETIGVWFLNTQMNIEPSRMDAANWVLQFSILSFAVSILSVPYDALIISHEHMHAFAFISIIEILLKLLIVFMITWFSVDKLKLYAVLTFVVALILRLIYGLYAKKNFKDSEFRWMWDKTLFNEMISFAGWNMIGVSSTLLRTQGNNIVLNLFFGTLINAAMGIANQVKQTVDNFTNSFLMALNPQITKSYAANDFKYLFQLVFNGSKYSFFLVFFLTLPLLLETEFVLKLWLKNVPDFTVIFVRLALGISLIESLSKTLIQCMFATGNIKKYQIVVGTVTILNLPLSVIFLYLGFQPQITLTIGVVIAIVALQVRLQMLKKMVDFPIKKYYLSIITKVSLVTIVATVIPFIIYKSFDSGFIRLALVSLSSLISILFSVTFFALSGSERNLFYGKILKYLHIKY